MSDKRIFLNVAQKITKPNGAWTEYAAGHYYIVDAELADAWIAEEAATLDGEEEAEKKIELPRSVPGSEPLLHDGPTSEEPEEE